MYIYRDPYIKLLYEMSVLSCEDTPGWAEAGTIATPTPISSPSCLSSRPQNPLDAVTHSPPATSRVVVTAFLNGSKCSVR